jgi:hypothetical protein
MSDLVLEPGDRANPLWPRIERHLQQRLVNLRAQLEGPKDIDETNRLRGRIAEVKALLDCAKDKPVIES